MNKLFIEELRRLSSVRGKQQTWISELRDDQLYNVFLRLRTGENCRSIARQVQQSWKVRPNSSIHSASQGLLKFKERIAHLFLVGPPSPSCEISSVDPSQGSEGDALEAMENIAQQYEARIKRMMAEEKQNGVQYPYINRDLQAMASLRKAILKQKEWESLHMDPSRQKEYQRIKQRIDRRFNAFMDDLGDEGQERLIRWADRFMELAEQNAVTAVKKEDGTYTLIRE